MRHRMSPYGTYCVNECLHMTLIASQSASTINHFDFILGRGHISLIKAMDILIKN